MDASGRYRTAALAIQALLRKVGVTLTDIKATRLAVHSRLASGITMFIIWKVASDGYANRMVAHT
jgi:hypothetical protein